MKIFGNAKDFRRRRPNLLMTAPGATFLACERGRWRQLVDGRLNRFIGQAGGMFGELDDLEWRALLFEGGRCFEPLRCEVL